MPTFKADLYNSQSDASPRNNLVDGDRITGRVAFATATYTTTGAEAAADIIQVAQLPVGAVVLPELSRISTDGIGGTGATVAKLGDAADDDRYSATAVAVVNAATATAFTGTNAQAVSPFRVTEATKVVTAALGLSSGSITAAKKLVFRIAYLLPG